MGTVDPVRWPWRRDRSEAWAEYLARGGSEGDRTPLHVRVITDEELEAEGYERDPVRQEPQ